MSLFTIIGASGFIGSSLAHALRGRGHVVSAPGRKSTAIFRRPLGHVIFAAGVTADFRTRPYDTVRAHVCALTEILERSTYDSLLYLSSARIYRNSSDGTESAAFTVTPSDPETFYDLTKLTGESICMASRNPRVRIARLTNVVGDDFSSSNFLYDLIRSAVMNQRIPLRSALQSSKDYVLIEDVVDLLPQICLAGTQQCYNVGGGRLITHAEIASVVCTETGASLSVPDDAAISNSPNVNISRAQLEFGFKPIPVVDVIPGLIKRFRKVTTND